MCSLTSPKRTYTQKTHGKGETFRAERAPVDGPAIAGGPYSFSCLNPVVLETSVTIIQSKKNLNALSTQPSLETTSSTGSTLHLYARISGRRRRHRGARRIGEKATEGSGLRLGSAGSVAGAVGHYKPPGDGPVYAARR